MVEGLELGRVLLAEQVAQPAQRRRKTGLVAADGAVVGAYAFLEPPANVGQRAGESVEPPDEDPYRVGDPAGVFAEFLLLPAVGRRLEQRQQRHRPRGQHPLRQRVIEELTVGLEGGGERRFAGHEDHHELGSVIEGPPVAFGGQLAHAGA